MRTTNTQFHLLVEYMEKYGDISKYPCTPIGRGRQINQWDELADILNGNGNIGPVRTSYQWRKVWSDFKNSIKRKAARGGSTPHSRWPSKASLIDRVLAVLSKNHEDIPSSYSGEINGSAERDETGAKVVVIDRLDDILVKPHSDLLSISDTDAEDDTSDDEPLALKKDYSIQNYSDSPDTLTIISNPEENNTPVKDSSMKNIQTLNAIKESFNKTETLSVKSVDNLSMNSKVNEPKSPTYWSIKENSAINQETDVALNVKESLAKHIQDMKGDTRYDKLMQAIGKDPKPMMNLKNNFKENAPEKIVKPKRKRRVIKCIGIDKNISNTVNNNVQINVSKKNLKPVPIEKLQSLLNNISNAELNIKQMDQTRSVLINAVDNINETRNAQTVVEDNNKITKDVSKTIENKAAENKKKENNPVSRNKTHITPNETTNNIEIPNNSGRNVPNPITMATTRKRARSSYTSHETYNYHREIELVKLEIQREEIKMKNRCISLIENLLNVGDNKG